MTLPNLLSILRMCLVPFFAIAVLNARPGQALALFAIAGLTDALDGSIARFWNQQSKLGAYLDPMADKLLLVTAYVVLTIPHQGPGVVIPLWVTGLVITRDVVIVGVAAVLYLSSGISSFPPSLLSKINTGTQIAAVILVLFSGLTPDLEPVALFCCHAVAVLTLASGIDYVRRAHRMTAPPH